ncbi:MAG: hypothetical protein FJY37_01210 [Betaproteobacteria bacterium]|nr:hypothetical protein [Betaproteobacteria bacterium]
MAELTRESSSAGLEESAALKRHEGWEEYRLWNMALGDHFFSGHFANQPVYIDIDDATRKALVARVVGKGDPVAHLIASIRATLAEDSWNPYSAHLDNERRWTKSGREGCPPFLGLLAFFSLVAEQMVASQDFAPHNYYGRLFKMLGYAEHLAESFQRGYREAASKLWTSLNQWIAEGAGARGYPTARALDHRKYVSIAISQALVRQHDRLLLRRIFAELGLEPRQRIQVPEMKSILLSWVSSRHGTSSLARLLRRGPDVQARVADIATSELEAWDGRLAEGERIAQARLFLAADLRQHPLPEIDLYLAVTPSTARAGVGYQLRNPGPVAREAFAKTDGRVRLEMIENLGFLALEPWAEIRVGDALLARLEFEPPERGGTPFVRTGQAIAVLSFRVSERIYREVTQPSLLDQLLVLAHESVAPAVNKHLELCARAGYQVARSSELKNLPDAWVAFVNVQIAQRIEAKGLEALTPISDRQLLLSGGISLGRDTWHAEGVPEVLIAAQSNQKFDVELHQSLPLGEVVEPLKLGSFEGAAAITLQGNKLPDGDYDLVVNARKGKSVEIIEHVGLRLRCSDNALAPQFVLDGGLLAHTYQLGDSSGPLSAAFFSRDNSPSRDELIQGCVVGKSVREWPTTMAESIPERPGAHGVSANEEAVDRPSLTSTANRDIGSCVGRGYHVFQYPPLPPDAPRGQLVQARCGDCYVEVWSRVGGTRTKGRQPYVDRNREYDVGKVRSVVASLQSSRPETASSAVLFDALNYLRGGSVERVAALLAPIDDSPWAVTNFLHHLSALGHAEIHFDAATAKIKSWQMSPPALVKISKGFYVLSGWRSGALARALELAAGMHSGKCVQGITGLIPTIDLRADDSCVESICLEVLEKTAIEIAIVTNFAARLLNCVPALSELTGRLPKGRPPSRELERFDFDTAQWGLVEELDRPGAYRSRSRGSSYYYVAPGAVARKEGLVANVRTVKYLAARDVGRSLLGYSHNENRIIVPFGCELPDLFERAAVMCSGRVPGHEQGYVVYRDVPQQIAQHIWSRLVN